ncbi:MAG: VOC family protein [Bdellovibrionales bacterium]|nr:VOC family protein [Bdellovibrionales bacterium]
MNKIYTCIWSDDKAAEMGKFYKSIFKGSKVGKTAYWGSNPMGVKVGSVLTMHITLLGQKIMLLNGYSKMSFNESISFVVPCKTQREARKWNAVGRSTSMVFAGRSHRPILISGTPVRTRRRKKPSCKRCGRWLSSTLRS